MYPRTAVRGCRDRESLGDDQMKRRETLKSLGAAAIGLALPISLGDLRAAMARTQAARAAGTYSLRFFTQREFETATFVADLILPKDERSGSASDAGVPEFMDFICGEFQSMGKNTRAALAWLDAECRRREGKDFLTISKRERQSLLDQIAWPRRAPAELAEGVKHFNHLRDFTASGFFTSKVGIEDLGYQGNVPVHEWHGCPDTAVGRLMNKS